LILPTIYPYLITTIPVLACGATRSILKPHKAKKARNSGLHNYSWFRWWRRGV